MDIHFLVTSKAFSPTPGELDEAHDDYINPGAYALELGDFLSSQLEKKGYPTRFRCQEDWGHWLELEHGGKYTLAVCCANTGEIVDGQAEHRVYLEPNKPVIRKFFFKKIDVKSDVEKLAVTLKDIFQSSKLIDTIRLEDAA